MQQSSALRSCPLQEMLTHCFLRCCAVLCCVQSADRAFQTLLQVQQRDGQLRLNHFRRVKQLGAGDVGLVDLVQLQGTDLKFAMKTLDKWEMQERNKVARVLTEEAILAVIDHPFLATCYCTLQTDSHLHFVMEFCEGGELYGLLNAQPRKRLKVRLCREAEGRAVLGTCGPVVRKSVVWEGTCRAGLKHCLAHVSKRAKCPQTPFPGVSAYRHAHVVHVSLCCV